MPTGDHPAGSRRLVLPCPGLHYRRRLRLGENSYFDGELVRQLLGGDVVVTLEDSRLRRLKPLLEALHVVAEPRPADIISAVERAGLSSLNEGAKVSYEEKESRGKTSAENLRVG